MKTTLEPSDWVKPAGMRVMLSRLGRLVSLFNKLGARHRSMLAEKDAEIVRLRRKSCLRPPGL